MKHASCVFTEGRDVFGAAAVTDLGNGLVNVAVVTRGNRSKMEPGRWTFAEAQGKALEWHKELSGGNFVPSRWLEGGVEP